MFGTDCCDLARKRVGETDIWIGRFDGYSLLPAALSACYLAQECKAALDIYSQQAYYPLNRPAGAAQVT